MSDGSPAWQRFVQAFFGEEDLAWQEDLDLEAIDELSPDERAYAEQLLIEGLASSNWRVPLGLERLGSTQGLDFAKEQIAQAEGLMRLHTAMMLWTLESWPGAIEHVIRVMHQAPDWTTRQDAAIALRRFGDVRALEPLLATAAADPEGMPRYHAVESIMSILQVPPDDGSDYTVAFEVMSDDPATREQALARLQNTLAQAR